MLWMLALAAVMGPPRPELAGLRACAADEQPFSSRKEARADWYWRFDRIVIGEVVSVRESESYSDSFTATSKGTYRLRPVMVLKGRPGRLPKGAYHTFYTDDGQRDDDTPPIGQLQIYVEKGRDRGWAPMGEIRCLPIPPN